MVDGELSNSGVVVSNKTGKEYKVREVGLLTPTPHPAPRLYPGQMGYLVSNMKSAKEAVIGDTLHMRGSAVEPLLDIEPAKPMVYAGVYPFQQDQTRDLKAALERLCLNDSSVSISFVLRCTAVWWCAGECIPRDECSTRPGLAARLPWCPPHGSLHTETRAGI